MTSSRAHHTFCITIIGDFNEDMFWNYIFEEYVLKIIIIKNSFMIQISVLLVIFAGLPTTKLYGGTSSLTKV
jgi:hypothetical protein